MNTSHSTRRNTWLALLIGSGLLIAGLYALYLVYSPAVYFAAIDATDNATTKALETTKPRPAKPKLWRQGSTLNTEQVIRLLQPGDYLGEAAVFSAQAVQYDAVALEDSTFCSLSKDYLHQILRGNPELAIKILGDMSQRLQSAETQLESLGQKPAEQRLLDALRAYAGGQTTFTLRISKKDLASQIGVRPETLSRHLSRLQKNNLIHVDRKTITFLSPK